MVKAALEMFVLKRSIPLLSSPLMPGALIKRVMILAESRGRPLIASINVINQCNLHCAGCYWSKVERKQHRDEMTVAQGDELIQDLWNKGVRQFLFLGGEPMERRDEVAHWVATVAHLGGISGVITNATYGLPARDEWPRTHYMISCDGDRVGMDRVRGKDPEHGNASVFELVRQAAAGRSDVVLSMTISSLNVERIEPFVRETITWGIAGVAFAFATPNVGERQSFYLSATKKEEAVRLLLRLKEEFGDFIFMSKRALELLRPAEVARWSPRCPNFAAVSIRADGKPLERCIFGPQGDCSQCGCNIATTVVALQEGDRQTARMMLLPARRAGIV